MLFRPRLRPIDQRRVKAQGEIVIAGEIDVSLAPDADGPRVAGLDVNEPAPQPLALARFKIGSVASFASRHDPVLAKGWTRKQSHREHVTELPTFPNPINSKAHQAETPGEPASATRGLRHDWQKSEVVALLTQPLLDLVDQAREVHRRHHSDGTVQLASLYSIKTGACPEDCKYCPQSAHYAKTTGLKREESLDVDEVLAKAAIAKEAGATRFCMGAAWREVKDGEAFDRVLAMVRGVRALDMEACVTLGMLNQSQADRLADAGLTA